MRSTNHATGLDWKLGWREHAERLLRSRKTLKYDTGSWISYSNMMYYSHQGNNAQNCTPKRGQVEPGGYHNRG